MSYFSRDAEDLSIELAACILLREVHAICLLDIDEIYDLYTEYFKVCEENGVKPKEELEYGLIMLNEGPLKARLERFTASELIYEYEFLKCHRRGLIWRNEEIRVKIMQDRAEELGRLMLKRGY